MLDEEVATMPRLEWLRLEMVVESKLRRFVERRRHRETIGDN
jgi:hypothetical protein